jgi:filamentous hemagglutinin
MFGYSMTGLFSDANIDTAKQLNNTYQIGTRTIGAGQTVLGGLGVAASMTTAPVSCATGIGCVANAVVGTVSLDATYAGAKQVVSGNPESTFLNQGLQSLGMSPEAAGLVENALGIGSAATAGAVANKVIDQSIALGKLSAASYQNFATNGVTVTSEVMQKPQVQALIKEIQAGSPGMSNLDAINYAKNYIASGATIPQQGIAGPGSTLVKVVPKGGEVTPTTGYWMSPQQAQAIAAMTPEQAGQALGLPADMAANILKNGMDFYAITPKSGMTPNVFVSNVAGTTQGAVTMPGGAQQVIVPNRSQWTTPALVNPFNLLAIGGY